MNPSLPIGIFDSGIGGLTVARAIQKILPQERIIYFGDTAHLPYGEKSAEAIRGYAERITRFLLDLNCKMVVIACNTASAVGYKEVRKLMKDPELAVNVIDPVAAYVANKKYEHTGIIATKRTISSKSYPNKIKKLNPVNKVASLATPLLVPMIEEGFYNNKISQTIINSYLSKPTLKGIDSIVLACTHFPLIEPEISNYYKGSIEIIDSAGIVAQEVKAILKRKKLLSKALEMDHQFFVSDYTTSFEQTAKNFFGQKIKLEQRNIW